MSANNNQQSYQDLRQYLLSYFELHASQRLKTFNFFIIFCTLIATGYISVIKENDIAFLAIIFGFLISFFSFIFWKLDSRNRRLIWNTEEALKLLECNSCIEYKDGTFSPIQIFNYEAEQRKKVNINIHWLSWKYHYSFSQCFNLVFFIMGVLGILAAIYATWLIFSCK